MGKLFSDVFERDNRRCVYCGRDLLVDFETFMMAEEDHLVPISKGGQYELDNVVTSCAVCNRLKGSYMPEFELTTANRDRYVGEIRAHIMSRRADKMAEFTTWTHPKRK